MLKIYLYQNYTPNRGRNPYYFGNVGSFIDQLPDPLAEIDSYTFDYQTGTVKFRHTQPGLYNDITYMRVTSDPDPSTGGSMDSYTGDIEEFYHVERIEYQGGSVILHITEDYWANYAFNAIGTMLVTRCNRNIGTGVYDDIVLTEDNYTMTSLTTTVPDLAICWTAIFATSASSIFTGIAANYTGMYSAPISDFETIKEELSLDIAAIDLALSYVGGIYAVTGTTANLESEVINCYLVPDTLLIKVGALVPEFRSKTHYVDDATITPTGEVAPWTYAVPFEVTIDPDNEYYIGTKTNGIRLKRTTQPVTVVFRYVIGQSGLRVFVEQGDNSVELTEQFAVTITTNNGTINAQEQLKQQIMSIAGTLASGGLIGGPAGAAAGGLIGIGQAILPDTEIHGRTIGSGDGALTWRMGSGAIEVPYKQRAYKSVRDEKAHARMFGAKFAEWCDDFADIMSHPLLGGGDMSGFVYTYIEAEAQIKNVPAAAAEFIQSALRNGIYIDYYGGNNANGVVS